MRIQHNIAALNSYRNLTGNNNAVSKNLEKLSSVKLYDNILSKMV